MTQFLNVDLDIYSREDLQPLIDAFGKKVFVLHAGRERRTHEAHIALNRSVRNADAAIRSFCVLVSALPGRARKVWDSASRREFNIGVEAGAQPRAHETVLTQQTVKAAADVGARIVFTVYAPEGQAAQKSRSSG